MGLLPACGNLISWGGECALKLLLSLKIKGQAVRTRLRAPMGVASTLLGDRIFNLKERVSMTQEMVQKSYRGVTCLHCKHPIPISPLVASIEAELPASETGPVRHQKCQVFHLRCGACGKEKPYKIAEILEFEGAPVSGAPRAEPASTYLRELGNRSRTANA